MKYLPIITLIILLSACGTSKHISKNIIKGPEFVKGEFMDDYGIKYSINDTIWIQKPSMKFNIIKWNVEEQYVLAQNDAANKTEPGLYTRIDFIKFENMAPYEWGFCLSEYKAATLEDALNAKNVDRENPRKGCNGYPFSRMKKQID